MMKNYHSLRHPIGLLSFLCLLGIILLSIPPLHAKKKNFSKYTKSVFQILVKKKEPDYDQPWLAGKFERSRATAFLISDHRIVTNAHVVANALTIYLKKEGDPKLYEATTIISGEDCDLALVSPKDKSFFRGTQPISLSKEELPDLDETIKVIGYPMGIGRLSITKGVLSRIDFSDYVHSNIKQHVLLQTDAAINNGNSGGPMILHNKLVGIATQAINPDFAESMGFGIPVFILNHFLKDAQDGRYDGFVKLNVEYQKLNLLDENNFLNTPPDKGILVSDIYPGTPESKILEPGDIILEINGYTVYRDGTIKFMEMYLPFEQATETLFAGDIVELSILRNGTILHKSSLLQIFSPDKVRMPKYNTQADYLIFLGLVFQPMSYNLIDNFWDSKSITLDTAYYWQYFIKDRLYEFRREPVILTDILMDSINRHISTDSIGQIVHRVNGIKINSMKDLAEAFLHPVNNLHTIEIYSVEMPVIIPADDGSIQKRILNKYNIFKPMHLSN